MKFARLLAVLGPHAIKALLQWPVFSISAYTLVTRLRAAGVAPRTVVDVGANIGQFACAAEQFFKPEMLICYEPQPDCYAQLTTKLGGIASMRFRPIALGSVKGEIEFFVNSYRHSSSPLKLSARHREAFPNELEVSRTTVRVSTLDEESKELELIGDILIKLDVQGYEAQVLQGAERVLQRTSWVVLETSFEPLYEGEWTFPRLCKLMSQMGFEFSCPVGWLEDTETSTIIQMDALFTRRNPLHHITAGRP